MDRVYKVITEEYASDLERRVNKNMEFGWTVQGGVSVAVSDNATSRRTQIYSQAMVRRKL